MPNIRIKSSQFIYKTYIKWEKEKRGILSSSNKPDIEVATPPEFRGHSGVWTPEELFVASVNTCIMTTFLYYAEKERLKFLSYESSAEGILEKVEREFIFSEIVVTPKILVSSKNEVERVKDLINLSEKNCLISNSLKSKVSVKPEIEI